MSAQDFSIHVTTTPYSDKDGNVFACYSALNDKGASIAILGLENGKAFHFACIDGFDADAFVTQATLLFRSVLTPRSDLLVLPS